MTACSVRRRTRPCHWLPLGLARGVRLERAVGAYQPVRRGDVTVDGGDDAVRFPREMEAAFGSR